MTSYGKVENQILCARGCGFYGTSSNNNLCSQCYKAFLKEEEAKNVSYKKSSLIFHDDSEGTTKNVESTMKIKQRCMTCKKYPEEHACTYNFKLVGHVTLAKENPPCRSDKLETMI
ncbi:hypothetical protein H5410_038480 [Solanum commersonii]|uniref:A20-type domain-containing protein n=1 Tax=Solanum commersonii TaxID=4109 RepID=A0A9J5YCE7_SOLCO|nr:hypothetical protein H5410_038480 [Solanum commersonii]